MRRIRVSHAPLAVVAVLLGLLLIAAAVALGPMAFGGPRVLSITPADGAADANPQTPIQIEFDQWVPPEAVARALTFDPPAEVVASAELLRPWRSVILVRPEGGLRYGVRYKLTLRDVSNLLGRRMDQPRELAFATVPHVAATRFGPPDAAQDVPLAAPITVEFGAPVVPAEAIAAAAEDPRKADGLLFWGAPADASPEQLPPPITLDPPAAGVTRWLAPNLLGFYPEQPLLPGTTYTAALRPDLTLDGQARLAGPVSWTFTTETRLVDQARPADGAIDAPIAGVIEIALVPGVDPASAGAHFSLVALKGGAPVAGQVQTSENVLVFRPAAPLARGERYEARIAPGVATADGRALNAEPVAWRFTTIGDLEVAAVEPPPDTAEVLTTTERISVRFNHPVVALATIANQASLPQPLEIAPRLAGEGRWLDTSTYVFTPAGPLPPSTSYSVRVAAGLQDQTGGALQQVYSWSFSTVTPQVLDVVPVADELFAAPNGPIRVAFNQPMNPTTLIPAIRLRVGNGPQQVSGSIATDGNVAVFTPNAPLARGQRYSLDITQDALSATGTQLQSPYFTQFTVAPAPALLASEPGNGLGGVVPGGSVRLQFSAPMDWASVERHLLIEPEPAQVYTSTYQADMYLYFQLEPETDYRVVVGAAAEDAFGVALGQDAVIGFRTDSLPPSLALVGPYQVGAYNAYAPARVPLRTVNIPSISYDIYRFDPAGVAELLGSYDAWRGYAPSPDALVRGDVVQPTGERNKEQITVLDVGALDPGMYFIEVRGQGYVERQLMAVSPYALTVKRSGEELFVWAVDLASGAPAGDLALAASTSYYDYQGVAPQQVTSAPRELGATDSEGVLQGQFASGDPYAPIFLWSPDRERFAFATTAWSEGVSPWDFGLPASYGPSTLAGNLATDRPIYRPDQNVYIRGALRLDDDGDYSLPNGRAVLTIGDPEGTTILTRTLELSEFGTFHSSLPLEAGAKLGIYSLKAALEGVSSTPAQPVQAVFGTFVVAEYRKPAFEVGVTAARPDITAGETLEMTVEARYFSGGALANAPLRWRLLADPLYFSPGDPWSNYRFENLDDAYEWYRWFDNPHGGGGNVIGDGAATTDGQGRFTLSLPAALGDDGRSRRLTLDVEITDVDGQVIAAQGTANVHAGAFYIGLRPEGYVAQAGQPQTVALATLDPQGQPAPNRALTIGIYKREWYSVKEQGADGQFYFTSSYTDTLEQELASTTDAQGRGSFTFSPKEAGSYRIGASGKDDQGHTIKASAFTWAYGGAVFWGVNDTNRVDLIADKERYAPGETARILVAAPYKGMSALLTVERGTVLEHRLLTLPDTTGLLEVPLTAEHAPNVYVSLVLVKPVSGQADEPAAPDLRVGLVNLPVSTEQQELRITVTPDKTEAGPRESVTYTIKATDHAGRGVRAEVGLALVDKAVLTLLDDQNATLRQSFYEKRPLGVATAQTLTALVDRVTLKLQAGDKGGGGGGQAAEVLVRRNFPDTAYWNPSLVTGDDGAATVTLTLPDALTTWRMTARGITANTQVGQASQELIATRPLLARPALPRFLTVGDRPALQAVIHNNTAAPIDATVRLELAQPEDEAERQPALLQLNGPAEQQISVPANGSAPVRWQDVEVVAAGLATVRFTVSGGGQQDIVEQPLPIQRFETPEVVASGGQVFDTTVETIEGTGDRGQGIEGELRLELTPSLAAGVEQGLTYLEQYPYLCAEQTVSRFLANAVAYRLFKQLGADDAALKRSLDTNTAAGLQRLYSLQQMDGGWGWWPSDGSSVYLTAYVVQGLLEAQRAGYGVDPGALSNGIGFLQDALDRQAGRQATDLNGRAFALFVLAEAGQPDRGRTVALYERRHNLDIYGRAYVLMTLHALGSQEEQVRTLVGELMSSAILRPTDAHWEERRADPWNMSSDTRTTALALQALLRADPDNFLVPNGVRYLMALREQGHWRSTQETATALIALSEYIVHSGELSGDYTWRAALDGRTLREGVVNRDNLSDAVEVVLSLSDLASGSSALQLEKNGPGRLYYTLRMRSFEDAEAVQPLDRGVAVERAYVAVDTDTLTPTGQLVDRAELGEVVQVRLTISVPENVHHLVVEDMLPAGLEPLDTSLRTVSAAARDPQLLPAGRSDRPYWWYFSQTSIHDNRVALFATELPRGTYHYTYLARATTPGAFKTLPTTAYQMYAPEVFGRSGGAVFSVGGSAN